MSQSELPTGETKKTVVRSMFDQIAPTYEKANRVISFGFDKYGRRVALNELRLAPGSRIIDLASGTGDMYRMLAEIGHRPVACDLSFGMLHNARNNELRIQCDGTHLPFADNSVDGIVCGYALRNFVDLPSLFTELFRVLVPGGRFVAVDVSVPSNPVLKMGNRLWFAHMAPKLGWLISKNKSAYEYLPRSTSYLPDNETLTQHLIDAGAQNVHVSPLIGGSLILVSATKQPVRTS